ncbi:MAG: hypothetical protein COU11_03610 [Candidatus Harrisonbacteria bacterium CG10_big_fil_rev_8_21_14_0_10_49_15]|uniref:Uncharacterized protein n=1 Tax=Candidatus Harrisonbacteria bacterium CG10_big_fil_rev_8_21_14_0_10_49_15 TaxID=1974587 RepID=A0A2H0UKH8_9BACT|nr:MAG: hypothetical protein COU11_03610 [Candidatus Harrisonbacteria bacterium CG10_big_fil_rev_8_21_14_0_10_49_15]
MTQGEILAALRAGKPVFPARSLVLDKTVVLAALRERVAWARSTVAELRASERPVHPAFTGLRIR